MTTTYRTSRRNFLKTGATIGGVLVAPAFSARVFAETVKDGQTIITAAHWGPLAVVVKDGKINHPRPPSKTSATTRCKPSSPTRSITKSASASR